MASLVISIEYLKITTNPFHALSEIESETLHSYMRPVLLVKDFKRKLLKISPVSMDAKTFRILVKHIHQHKKDSIP